MCRILKKMILPLLCCCLHSLCAQEYFTSDTITVKGHDSIRHFRNTPKSQFGYKQPIIPSVLIGYGFAGLNSEWLKDINGDIRTGVRNNIDTRSSIDDYSRYFPVAAVYGLNAFGIKGKHNFKDRTIIF